MKNPSYFPIVPWLLSAVVAALSFIVWAQGLAWHFAGIGTMDLFPLFGILAFSLMWVHYAVDFLERFFNIPPAADYLPASRYTVLGALLLHPGLFAWSLWRQKLGWPPIGFPLVLGFLAWIGFLLFELYRWYKEHHWFKWIALLTDLAMIAIIFHALSLGGEVQTGWFHWVWLFYGVTLFISIGYYYYRVYARRK